MDKVGFLLLAVLLVGLASQHEASAQTTLTFDAFDDTGLTAPSDNCGAAITHYDYSSDDGSNTYSQSSLATGAEYRLDSSFPSASTTTTNTAPSFGATALTRRVYENVVVGTHVGAPVTATDADAGDTITYSLGGTNAASFAISASTGQISVASGVTLDKEPKHTPVSYTHLTLPTILRV